MELPGGGFASWPGGREPWMGASVYAAHFLVDARDAGFDVGDSLLDRTLGFLTDVVNGRRWRANASADVRAYALYVLACADRTEFGLCEAVASDSGAAGLNRLLAAAAMVRGGRGAHGAKLVSPVLQSDYLAGGQDSAMDSRARRVALALIALLDIDPQAAEGLRLLDALRSERTHDGHWGTTQSNSMAVAALGKWARLNPVEPGAEAVVIEPGGTRKRADSSHPYSASASGWRQPFTVEASGTVYCSWQARGVPVDPPTEDYSRGLKVERRYVNEAPEGFWQGDLVTVEITIRSGASHRNVAVVDLLPGCFEIEDAAFRTRCGVRDSSTRLSVDFVEKREDRVVLFCDVPRTEPDEPAVFRYAVRAVTRGAFTVPKIQAEAMYAPEVRSYVGDMRTLCVQ